MSRLSLFSSGLSAEGSIRTSVLQIFPGSLVILIRLLDEHEQRPLFRCKFSLQTYSFFKLSGFFLHFILYDYFLAFLQISNGNIRGSSSSTLLASTSPFSTGHTFSYVQDFDSSAIKVRWENTKTSTC